MIGQTVSHYKIAERLGGGGMGVVYKAVDTKLDRPVALKFLPPELTRDPDAKRRFVHEAKAASALQHHNICTIHEIDETDDGRVFICMDCYEGETLKQRIARGALPVDEAIDIVNQVAEGLTKAHAEGMVHRDIKPANIMITTDGVVKIVDFGLAKLAGQTRVTKTGTTVGTVAYMSPEQATGKDLDHRSDVWSLGVVLYEMLTGELPFRGDHEAAVLYGIMNTEPESVTTSRKDIPEQVQQIVHRCMAKESERRYESAAKLLEDLAPLRSQRAVGAGSSQVGRKTMSVKSAAGILIAVVLIAAIAFVVAKQRGGGPSADDFSLAIVDFRDLVTPDDPATSAEITGLLHVGLVESSPMRVVSPDYLRDLRRRSFGSSRGPIEEDQVLEVARNSGAKMFLSGQIKAGEYVMWRLVDTRSGNSLGADRVDGRNVTELADLIIADVVPLLARESGAEAPGESRSVTTLTTASEEAYKHYTAGMLASEEQREADALRELELAVSLDSTFALAFFELSQEYTREHALARVYSDKAWVLRSNLGIQDRMRLEAWRSWVDYRVEDALATEREMLARWPDDRAILKDHVQKLYANWYSEESLQIAERGVALYPDDLTFGVFYWIELANAGRPGDALEALKAQSNFPEKATVWDDLGSLYFWMGLPDSAEAAYHRALQIDPNFTYSHMGIGVCAYARGDLGGAVRIIKQVLERADLSPSQQISFRVRMMNWLPGLAWIYAEAGRFKEAFEAIEETRQYASDPDSELRWVVSPRNKLLIRAGRADEVLEWARVAMHSEKRIVRLQSISYQAQALVALDSLKAARTAIEELGGTKPYWGGYTWHMTLKLTARIALAEGDYEAALTTLGELGRHTVQGGYWDIEHKEMLARAYRIANRLEEAATVHHELLRVHGGHALSHYALGQIYEEMRRPADAQSEYEIFLDMWSQADDGLPQVEDARTRRTALRQTTQ